jgi:hypothetical protein
MTRGRSLFWTIASIFLLTAVVGTLLQALVASAVLQPFEAREFRARAELAASAIATAIESEPVTPTGAELDSLLARHRVAVRPAWIVFRASDGSIVTAPPGRLLGGPHPGHAGGDSILPGPGYGARTGAGSRSWRTGRWGAAPT